MKPKASLIIGIFCLAFSPIFVKLAVAPPVTSGFYRIFIAWLCLFPYCIIKQKLKIERRELLIALLGGVVFASDIAVWNMSLTMISATVSTLLANLAPVWVGLLSLVFFKRKSGNQFWIGTAVAIAGMVILVGYRNVIARQFNTGILLAILASIFYAIYILITRGILQKVSTFTFMFYSMLAAAVFLLLINVFQQNNLANYGPSTWLCFLGMGVICQLAGWLTINYSLRFLAPAKVAVALLGQTILASFMAIFFLKEKLELKEIIGSAIVLGGIAITFLKRNKIVV